jgi:hypothetical protein
MDKAQFIQHVTAHLRSKGGLIAVTQESNRLFNPHALNQKYNWSFDDVVKEFGSVEQMLIQLKDRGFSNGATLALRKKAGSTARTINSVTLSFDKKPEPKPIETPNSTKEQAMNPPSTPTTNHHTQQQMMPALGMSYVQEDVFLDLKLKALRFGDLEKANNKLEKDNDRLESDLRIAKEDNRALERKIETLEDRHSLKIERLEADKKKFWESESGKQAIEAGMTGLSQLAAGLMQQKAAAIPALGAALSQDKQLFISQLEGYPDKGLPFLGKIIDFIITKPEFQERIVALISEFENV